MVKGSWSIGPDGFVLRRGDREGRWAGATGRAGVKKKICRAFAEPFVRRRYPLLGYDILPPIGIDENRPKKTESDGKRRKTASATMGLRGPEGDYNSSDCQRTLAT